MNFVCIFRPRITGPWQGAVTELRQRCRAVRRVPPQPPSSHTAGLTEFLDSHQLWDCQTFPEMYLKISAASLADPEEMRYITPGHPASGKYHTGNNISAYT